MSNHRIIVEFIGVPAKFTGLLEGFFQKIRSELARISDFEITEQEVFCFSQFSLNQNNTVRIFIRYSSTSSALLDADWKSHAHARISRLIVEKFQADSVEKIE